MSTHTCFRYSIISGAFLLAVAFSASPGLTADKASAVSSKATPPAASTLRAVGSVEDSLQACLARIPKDATAGQRMIAEQSCQRDEGDRKPFQATGGR